jgi:hypothetical protein
MADAARLWRGGWTGKPRELVERRPKQGGYIFCRVIFKHINMQKTIGIKVVHVIIPTISMSSLYVALYSLGVTRYNVDENGGKISVMDLIHVSIVTQFTVGYGDISPVINNVARITSWIHMFFSFVSRYVRRVLLGTTSSKIRKYRWCSPPQSGPPPKVFAAAGGPPPKMVCRRRWGAVGSIAFPRRAARPLRPAPRIP